MFYMCTHRTVKLFRCPFTEKGFNWKASAIPNFRLRVMYFLKELHQRSRRPCLGCFHLTMCCISMNNRCVEHVLEDNKWTVLVLIVSDDIGILGNSHGNTGITTPWTAFISHETAWKLLRHLNQKEIIAFKSENRSKHKKIHWKVSNLATFSTISPP